MEEKYVSFHEIEDGVATLVLYKPEGPSELFHYQLDELPAGVDRDQFGGKFRPEFDDDGEIAALHYDEDLTQQKQEEVQSELEEYREMIDDSG